MDEALLPSQSARFTPIQVPRLGIIHLLAWTTVTAVLLGTGQHTVVGAATRDSTSGTILWSQAILYITRTALLAAATVASATVLRAWWTRGGAWAPGHALALIYVLVMCCFLIISGLLERTNPRHIEWSSLAYAATMLLSTLAYGAFAVRSTFPRRWRITFWINAGADLTWSVESLAESFGVHFWAIFGDEGMLIKTAVWATSMLLALGVSAIGDLARHQSRDWAHWVGALSRGVLLLLNLGALFL